MSYLPTQHPSSPPIKQSRSRVIQTCLPCHRAKRKCNRKKPCSQCLKRQVTGSCVYEAIAAEDAEALGADDRDLVSQNQALRSRIADLEAAVTEYKAQLLGATASGSRKRQRNQSDVGAANDEDKDGVYYGQGYYLGGQAAPDLLRRMMSLVPNDQRDLLFAFSGSSTILQSRASPGVYMFPTVFPINHGVKEMLNILEDLGKPSSDRLLDAYYDLVDPLHHYCPTPWLMQRYDKCWEKERERPHPQEAALVFAILALGDLVSDNANSWFLLSASMQLLRVSNFFASPSMDCIHTFCYIAVYLQHEGKLGEYWPLLGLVIRLAQSMALHRDPSLILNLSPEEGELRRRLFWTVATQETALSSMFGRPIGIGFTDCKLPKDISDDELFGEQVSQGEPTNKLSNEVSYNRYTWELGSITREMLKNAFQSTHTDSMPRVKALESRIRTWYYTLPSGFKFDVNSKQPEQSSDPESKRQYVQSVILFNITHHNILVLYRKPLLSNIFNPVSRKPCFEAAFAVADSWKVLQDSFPKMAKVTWMLWFRAFHAALICLVIIRTDGPRSDFRSRALACWLSCLRIFARIKDQNESIMSCWRALSRLDVVAKKEMEADRRPRRYSNPKNLRDTSAQLLVASSTDVDPFSSTVQEIPDNSNHSPLSSSADSQNASNGVTPDSINYISSPLAPQFSGSASALDPALSKDLTAGSTNNFPAPAFGTQYSNIFDMDIQNWPSWLTDEQSPDFT